MGEPSVSSAVSEPVESPLMELIQLYRVEQAMLAAHQREVERRRAAVRTAAEREASEILLAARREIRRVLVRTRQELATLNAQVRAAGCEPAPGQAAPPIVDDDFQLSAARDVRDVLRDARSELDDLSKEAVNLWAAREAPALLPPAPEVPPLPAPSAGQQVSSAASDESGHAAPSDQLPANGSAAQFVVRWRTAESPAAGAAEVLLEHWRIAVIGLAILAVIAVAFVALRPSSGTEEAVVATQADSADTHAQAPPAAEAPATEAAATAGNVAAAPIAAPAKAGSAMLSLTLEVLRPVWLRINADGGEDAGRTYQQGERRTIQAAREILLRAGDAGAVVVSVGGGAPVPLGPDGQVRTRRFANQGAAATNPTGQPTTPARASEAPPLAAVPGGVAGGLPPNEPPAANPAQGADVSTSTADRPDHVVTAADYAAAAEREILERHQRWFDAFERGDRTTMSSLAATNFSLIDQRPERAPAAGRVERFIHDLRVQVTAGVGAVVSGRITETSSTPEEAPTVAMFSEVWIRQGEEWQLVSVRLVPVNAVPTTLQ